MSKTKTIEQKFKDATAAVKSYKEALNNILGITEELETLNDGLQLPMPEGFHIEEMRYNLPDKIERIREVIIKEGGK